MATEVASLFVRFFAKDDGVKREFEEIQREAGRTTSQVHSHSQRMAEAFRSAGERMRGVGETIIDMGDNLSQALSLPFMVVGGAATMAAFQTDQAMSIIGANFGQNAQLAAQYGNIVQNALRSGLAESAQQAALDVVTLAQTFGRLKPETMQVVAEKAQAMAMAMGTSVDDIASRAKELKDTFGISLSQALDLVARGFDVDKVKAIGLKNALAQSRGAAQQMTQEMMNSPMAQLRGQWNQLLQTLVPLGGVLLDLANQALPRITSAVQSAVQWFQGLSDSQQNLVIGLGLLAVALPPVIMFFGALAMSIGAIIDIIGVVVGVLGTIFGAITAPVWAVIGVIAALIGAFLLLRNYSTQIANYLRAMWAAVVAFFRSMWQGVVTTWNSVLTSIRTTAISIWNGIVSFLVAVWNRLRAATIAVWNAIKTAVVTAFQWMYNHNYYFQYLVDFIRNAWNRAKAFTTSAWNAVKSFLSSAWNSIKSRATSIFNSIRSTIQSIWNHVRSVTSSVWSSIRSVISSAVNAVRSIVISAWNAIRSATASAFNAVRSIVTSIWHSIASTLSSLASRAWSWGANLLSMFIAGIRAKIGELVGVLKAAAGKVAAFLGFHSPTEEGPAHDSDTWAPNFVDMYVEGLKRGIPKISSVVNSMADSMTPLSAPSSGGSSALAGHTFNINVYTDDRRTGRTIARTINRELWLHHA